MPHQGFATADPAVALFSTTGSSGCQDLQRGRFARRHRYLGIHQAPGVVEGSSAHVELIGAFAEKVNEGTLLDHKMEPSITSVGFLALLGLGLVFGLKHATEVDHVVAVSAIVSQHRSVFRSALVGGSLYHIEK